MIIHNLPKRIKQDFLREQFKPFGNVIEVTIPPSQKDPAFNRGFGIVGFDTMPAALKAIKGMNGKKLLRNIIAVDLCLPKRAYQKLGISSHSENKKGSMEQGDEVEGTDNEDPSSIDKKNDASEESGSEGSNEDSEEEDQEGSEQENSIMNSESDDEQSNSEDHLPSKAVAKNSKKPRKQSDDVKDGRTLFIKNLHFDTEDEDLAEVMGEFGPLIYCLICRDQVSGHPKGTAFVRFKSKESADAALAASNDENDDRFVIDGRRIHVTPALPKEQVATNTKDERIKDKRNLYLAKEGTIYPESPAAKGVSQADLSKRLEVSLNDH